MTVVSACAAEPSPTHDSVFDELIASAISEAAEGGAHADQIALLEDARASGELPLEHIRSAMHATVECLVDAGVGAEYLESTGVEGLTVASYRVFTTGDFSVEEELFVDECDSQHNFWVNKVYQVQPSSHELRVAFVNSVADELRACLEDAGFPTEPDATGVELSQQAGSVAVKTGAKVDCLAKVGVW